MIDQNDKLSSSSQETRDAESKSDYRRDFWREVLDLQPVRIAIFSLLMFLSYLLGCLTGYNIHADDMATENTEIAVSDYARIAGSPALEAVAINTERQIKEFQTSSASRVVGITSALMVAADGVVTQEETAHVMSLIGRRQTPLIGAPLNFEADPDGTWLDRTKTMKDYKNALGYLTTGEYSYLADLMEADTMYAALMRRKANQVHQDDAVRKENLFRLITELQTAIDNSGDEYIYDEVKRLTNAWVLTDTKSPLAPAADKDLLNYLNQQVLILRSLKVQVL